MSITRVFSNSFAQIFVKCVTVFVGIAMVKILSSGIGADGYGVYAKVHNYVALFAALADMGLFAVSVKEIRALKNSSGDVSRYLQELTGLRIILGAVFSFVAILVAFFLPGYHEPIMLLYIGITCIFVIFGLVFSSYLSYLQAELRTQVSALPSIIGRLVALAGACFLVFALSLSTSATLLYVFLFGLVGNIVMVAALLPYIRGDVSWKPKFSSEFIIRILREHLWYILAIFFSSIFLRVDLFMVSIFVDTEGSHVYSGYYGVISKLLEVGIFVGVIFMNSLLPLMVDEQSSKTYWTRTRVLGLSSMLLSGFIFGMVCWFFSGFIVELLSDRSFVEQSAPALRIVGWSIVFHFLGLFFSYDFLVRDAYKPLFYLYLFVFFVNVFANYYGISQFGFIGVAIATLLSQIFFFFGSVFLILYERVTQLLFFPQK